MNSILDVVRSRRKPGGLFLFVRFPPRAKGRMRCEIRLQSLFRPRRRDGEFGDLFSLRGNNKENRSFGNFFLKKRKNRGIKGRAEDGKMLRGIRIHLVREWIKRERCRERRNGRIRKVIKRRQWKIMIEWLYL